MAENNDTGGTAAYLPWTTLMNALDQFAENLPNRVDRSVFPGQSGGSQNQLIQGLRFLGLIADTGTPTAAMHTVAVKDADARKAALKQIIEQRYAALFALNLMKTTPAELAEKMTEAYNVSGDTRLKATRFFLNAASYLGVPVSPLLLRDKSKPTGATTTRKRRTPTKPRPDDVDDNDDGDDDPPATAAESRSVELRSGGTLTLSATTKFMALSSADRKFVFDLIDKLEAYETADGLIVKDA